MPLHTKTNELERCCASLIRLLEAEPTLLNEGERLRLETWVCRLLSTIQNASKATADRDTDRRPA